MIPAIARFMECCYGDWLEHITEKRDSYLLLNYFTVNQLVILQRELVKFGREDRPSQLIFPLLSFIKPECTEGKTKCFNQAYSLSLFLLHIHISTNTIRIQHVQKNGVSTYFGFASFFYILEHYL